jgi:hypothetical protein
MWLPRDDVWESHEFLPEQDLHVLTCMERNLVGSLNVFSIVEAIGVVRVVVDENARRS